MNSERWAHIRRLFEVDKLSKNAIARRLGIHRRSVRRALSSPSGPPADRPRPRTGQSKLTPHHAYLQARLKEFPELSARKLWREIQPQGYSGGYSVVKKHVRSLRDPAPKTFLRLETRPGEFAQVDWANVGTVAVGNVQRKLSCFVMVLSYSRRLYLEFTLSQCLEDFLACHVNAFHFFGGVPKKINYANLKTVVLARFGKTIQFNPRFLDFAGVHLFEPVPCNVRAGWEKGKVENTIKYIRSSFLAGRSITAVGPLQKDAVLWRDQQANTRIHGATRQRPIDRFPIETPLLHPLPPQPDDTAILRSVKATSQALVHFESNRYSVPASLAGRTWTLKATPHDLFVFDATARLAHHPRSYEKFRVLENPLHFKGLLAQRKSAQATKEQEAFLALLPEAKESLAGLLDAERASRHDNRIRRLIQEAKFPALKTIDAFDWAHPAVIPKALVLQMTHLDFVHQKQHLIFVGPGGVGKTHLATALGFIACQHEIRTLFTTAADMINTLVASQADHRLGRALKKFTSPKRLIVDELGYLPLDKQGRDLFFQVVSKRAESGSMILTTNKAFRDGGEVFLDNAVATAMAEPLMEHGELIKIEGGSYRVKKKTPKISGIRFVGDEIGNLNRPRWLHGRLTPPFFYFRPSP